MTPPTGLESGIELVFQKTREDDTLLRANLLKRCLDKVDELAGIAP